jgi:hypothetical protein
LVKYDPVEGQIVIFGIIASIGFAFAYALLWIRNIRTDINGFSLYSGVLRLRFIEYSRVRSVELVSYQRRTTTYYKTILTLDNNKTINIGDKQEYHSLTIQLESRCKLIRNGVIPDSLKIYGGDVGLETDSGGYICEWEGKNK